MVLECIVEFPPCHAFNCSGVRVKEMGGGEGNDIRNLPFKGILCDLFIFTLDQIIVLNKYCTYMYNKPIPKILCQNTTELV